MRHRVFQPVLDCAAPLPLTKPHQQFIFHYNNFFFFFLKCALLRRQISNANPNLSVICRLNTTRSVIKGVFESLLKQFKSYSQGMGRGCLCRCFFIFIFLQLRGHLECVRVTFYSTPMIAFDKIYCFMSPWNNVISWAHIVSFTDQTTEMTMAQKTFLSVYFFFFYCPISFFCSAKIVQGNAVCSVKQHFSVTLITESPLRAAPLAFFKQSAVLYQ